MARDELQLLQGTLDVLVMKTLSGGRATATTSRAGSARRPTPSSRSRTARSTCRCTAWKSAVARSRVGPDRQQPQREVLPAHARRPEAARREDGDVVALCGRRLEDPADRLTGGGIPCRAYQESVACFGFLSEDRVSSDVDAEITFHVEERTQELIAQGLDPAAARAAAMREFGDVREARAELETIGRRRVRTSIAPTGGAIFARISNTASARCCAHRSSPSSPSSRSRSASVPTPRSSAC